MEQKAYKILPDGSASFLSLNKYTFRRGGVSPESGPVLTGEDIYSFAGLREQLRPLAEKMHEKTSGEAMRGSPAKTGADSVYRPEKAGADSIYRPEKTGADSPSLPMDPVSSFDPIRFLRLHFIRDASYGKKAAVSKSRWVQRTSFGAVRNTQAKNGRSSYTPEDYYLDRQTRKILRQTAFDLADLLASLTRGDTSARTLNPELSEHDWMFWASCKDIFFDGGISGGQIGDYFLRQLRRRLSRWNCSVRIHSSQKILSGRYHRISPFTASSLIGCAKSIADAEKQKKQAASEVPRPGRSSSRFYVFDFGSTAVKRGRVLFHSGRLSDLEITTLPSVKHGNFWDLDNNPDTGQKLHDFICHTICDTIRSFEQTSPASPAPVRISMCIANNILDGQIADRGGYRYLRFLGDNYPAVLSRDLSRMLECPATVHIMNDAEAVSCLFRSYSPTAAVITLGTHIGISYP